MDAAASFLGADGARAEGFGPWAGGASGADVESAPAIAAGAVSALDDVRMLPASLHAMLAQPDDAYIGGVQFSIDVGAVDVAQLKAAVPLRSTGLDDTHVASLVDAEWPLNPILVHLPTMQVIDGHHRMAAAVIKGIEQISAHLFDGPLDVAYLLALRANVAHGLPLSLSDRKAAARHLLERHGNWSDRAIAAATGLSAKVVAKLRCATADEDQLHGRVGRDGRCRPLNTATKRAWAAEILSSQPGTSLRQVARAVGLSPGTVRDVLDRVQRGEDPVLNRRGAEIGAEKAYGAADQKDGRSGAGAGVASGDVPPSKGPNPEGDEQIAADVLAKLARDPALRLSDAGRDLLRRLHRHAISSEDCAAIVEASPDRSVEHLAAFAQTCSRQWASIAEQLTARYAISSK